MSDVTFVPDESHVARLCGDRGYDPDKKIVTHDAFNIRKCDKGKLSVDWVECAYVEQHSKNAQASLQRLKDRGAKYSQYVAFLTVKNIRNVILNKHHLDVINILERKSCHSLIVGFKKKGECDAFNETLGFNLAKLVEKVKYLEV